jgi:hypothetical protein
MKLSSRLLTGAAAAAGTFERSIFVSELSRLSLTVGLYWFDHFHRTFRIRLGRDEDLLT